MLNLNYRSLRNFPLITLSISIFLFFAIACSESTPSVKGTIEDADNELITLEKSDYIGNWVIIDSVRTKSNGNYSLDIPRQPAPMVFRLGLNGKYVYFPVDSTETITLNSRLKNFDTHFTLDGSDDARNLMSFEKELIALPADADAETLSKFKRTAYTKYMQPSQGSVVAYYVLTKIRGNKPLYDPEDAVDQRYYAAVATAFSQFAPDDPRTPLLEQTALRGLRARNAATGQKNVVEANESSIIDIKLSDENNREVSLSSLTGNGKPTLLVFSLMNQPESPAFNAQLSKLLKDNGNRFNVYHVCFDSDILEWREAAVNIPWTTVIDPNGSASKVMRDYNISSLPTFYIINAQGELTDKADNFDQLGKLMSKH